ncbi:MAG: transcription-repair coupling factor [Neisseria sp.]|nr:transcription-repair coupling factor [Neisseria sp.]
MFASFSFPTAAHKSLLQGISVHALPLLLADHASGDTPLLILTENAETAQQQLAAWRLLAPHKRAVFFPDWETLPYEHFSPHRDLVSERLAVLWHMQNHAVDVVLMPVATAMQKLPPPSFIAGRTFCLRAGDRLDVGVLRANLAAAGYHAVSNVVAAGEFAVRGGLVDLFPTGSDTPYRLDLFGDEIDTIKIFDPDTQRTVAPVSEIRLLPAHEFPTDENAVAVFRRRFREIIEGDPSAAIVYKAVSDGMFGGGVEYYLPLFFDEPCVTLDAYLGESARVIALTDINAAAGHFAADIKSRFTMAHGEEGHPPLAPEHLYLSAEGFQAALKPYARLNVDTAHDGASRLPDVAADRKKEHPLQALQDFQAASGARILLCAQSAGRRETMLSFLRQQGLSAHSVADWAAFTAGTEKLCVTVSELAGGFRLPESLMLNQTEIAADTTGQTLPAVISENDLYPFTVKTRTRRRKHQSHADGALRDLAEIRIGDPVVHEAHGIGRYAGLVNMDLGEGDEEMMLLEYAEGAQLYVPVSQLHVISRYAGVAHDDVVLHRLGSTAWGKAKQKAAQKARDTAAELLNLYAQRAAQSGHAFQFDEHEYGAFADGFEYAETEDQAAAIVAVVQDLLADKPMDRLVCGDVGFGKTEVALRAAFVAVSGGKQVALLAPTTLLVEQHAQVFTERFADFPVNVAALSRFSAGKSTRAVLAGMEDGSVDIVIGTHKLIQPDITFKNLGLVIIDEEHRFGVRQKEQLKRLRANVDVLTLTATPIPRTLSMALDGLRDFSLITTAPERRLAVKTFVKPFSEASVREAMLREFKRGGQVFFLHNEVDTIENMRERLEKLLPEARIGIAHGQLPAHDLERVMRQFLQQQYNVLLCSTIIETGIDIPNANTIIINRADRFGIAQLHQLRGRVGRSHHQAYAYLFTPEHPGRDAQKRLDAIAEADELGAGFMLAMQDLEIRGAGEILGEGQSGEITQVGLTLFGEMLKQAVRDLKSGCTPDLDAPLGIATEVKLHAPALLPESYCPDVHERLVLYKRLAACDSADEIDAIHEELIDRFGLPAAPGDDTENSPVHTLLESHRLRIAAKAVGIETIDATAEAITLTFGKQHSIDPTRIIALMQSNAHYRLAGQNRLRVTAAGDTVAARVRNVKGILSKLTAA